MAFLLLGLALLAMKALEYGPVAEWSWWLVLAPFGLAVLWWAFSDATGRTQRIAIEKMEKRKVERRQRDMEALGLTSQRTKQVHRARVDARRAEVEAERPRAAAGPAPADDRREPRM